MATALQARLIMSILAQIDNPIDVGVVSYPVNLAYTQQFTDGVAADQAQKIWTDLRTIAISGTDDLDLNGVLLDQFGVAINMTKLKALIIKAASTNVNDVVVGGAAANQVSTIFGTVTDKVKIKPNGMMVLVAPDINGYGITAATADILRVANGGAGTTVDYTITLIGL